MPPEGGTPNAPAPAPSPGAPPPAAEKVIKTAVSESDAGEMVELKRKLSEAERSRRDVELRNAQLEDECRTLRTPAPVPMVKKKRSAPLTAYEAFADDAGED